MDLFRLVATLGMDTSEYDKKIGSARTSFKSFGDNIGAKAVAIGTLLARGIEKAADAALRLGQSTIDAAAEVAAETAQFQAAFGDLQGAAEKAFSSIEKSTGIFGTRLKNVGTKAFSQFKGAGLDATDALSSMERYTNLAADAAAYYDISLEAADERLRSFLRGNTEAGDAIGLFTSESQRNTYAMEKYGEKWTELTEAQKQMLMLDVASDIYRQSGAIGQAARESDAWTNVMENLKEAWRQAQAKFGAPIMAVITPKIQEFTDWIKGEGVQTKIEQFGLGVANAVNWILNPKIPTWEEVKIGAHEKLDAINEGLKGVVNWALGLLGYPDVDSIASDFENWWNGIGDSPYERIKAAAKWALGELIMPSTENVYERFKRWWDEEASVGITSITQWTFGELIVPLWYDIMMTVKDWWDNTIKPQVKKITTWEFGDIEFPSLDTVVAKATAWWNSIKSTVSQIFKVAISPAYSASYPDAANSAESNIEAVDIISGPSYKVPGFSTGLDYVPRDNFYARLHEGEAVLTKTEATQWRRGSREAASGISAGEIAAAVADALDGAFVNMDGERVGRLLIPTVSRGMAQEMRSRRYAT